MKKCKQRRRTPRLIYRRCRCCQRRFRLGEVAQFYSHVAKCYE